MLLLIDNYDSFTYNLAQYLGELGAEVRVVRNDAIDLDGIAALAPSHIVVSPGPGTPEQAGISVDVIRRYAPDIPILGVCLGHQAIGHAFGGRVVRAERLMHGKVSPIEHDGKGIFQGLPSPFTATRYHSLIVAEPLPDCLEVSARTPQGELMALRHRSYPAVGVQFHPESFLTEHGHYLLRSFLESDSAPSRDGMGEVSPSGQMPGAVVTVQAAVAKLLQPADLTEQEAESAMAHIMHGQATPAQIGAFLTALRMKGETVAEITGSARAMRAHAAKLTVTLEGAVLDTAGTGGDGAHTFNISTAAAFVIAGAGRAVAKHGNRAASSQCGSADVLAALGVSLDLTPEQVGRCIEEVGIGFLFAPKFHPAMKHAVGPRRELGQRTIFNVLGPLTNPASATHQIIGVYDPALTQTLAEVLGALGSHAALVFHGHGGLDELTTAGPNHISHFCEGSLRTFEFDPADPEPAHGQALPLRRASRDDLRGGDPAENARMLRDLLMGRDASPRRDVVLLNAAAALAVDHCDLADHPYEVFGASLAEAEQSLASGAALAKLGALIATSQRFVLEQMAAV
jgi:anthranilate synthase/phosphoribosyltransferase